MPFIFMLECQRQECRKSTATHFVVFLEPLDYLETPVIVVVSEEFEAGLDADR